MPYVVLQIVPSCWVHAHVHMRAHFDYYCAIYVLAMILIAILYVYSQACLVSQHRCHVQCYQPAWNTAAARDLIS